MDRAIKTRLPGIRYATVPMDDHLFNQLLALASARRTSIGEYCQDALDVHVNGHARALKPHYPSNDGIEVMELSGNSLEPALRDRFDDHC